MTQKMLEEKLMKAFQVIKFSKYVTLKFKIEFAYSMQYNIYIAVLNGARKTKMFLIHTASSRQIAKDMQSRLFAIPPFQYAAIHPTLRNQRTRKRAHNSSIF